LNPQSIRFSMPALTMWMQAIGPALYWMEITRIPLSVRLSHSWTHSNKQNKKHPIKYGCFFIYPNYFVCYALKWRIFAI
jgi:hypothetical protein